MTVCGEYECVHGSCIDGELICECDGDVCDGGCVVPYMRVGCAATCTEDMKQECIDVAEECHTTNVKIGRGI